MVENHAVQRIALWLDGHPDATDHYLEFNRHPAAVKAYESKTPPNSHTTRKRKILAEVSHNIHPEEQEVEMSKNTRDAAVGQPRKARRIEDRRVPIHEESVPDLDETPRAKSSSLAFASRTEQADTGSPTRSNDTRSSASIPRSLSPVKRIGDLSLGHMPIRLVASDDDELPLPQKAEDLTRNMKKISKGVGLIPSNVMDLAKANNLFISDDVEESNFSDCAAGADDNIAAAYVFREATHIVKAARMCVDDLLSEASWNDEVHSRVLNLALNGLRKEKGVWYMNVTSARISPSLLQISHPAKMVDYALVIYPPRSLDQRSLEQRILNKLASFANPLSSFQQPVNQLTINHTKAEYLRFKPIAVSIETKRADAGDEEAGKIQLGVWAGAQYRKLKELIENGVGDEFRQMGQLGPSPTTHAKSKVNYPILPLVLIQGHDWKLKIASLVEGEYDEATGQQQKDQVLIHGDWVMGDTRGILGMYKLVEGLKALAAWTRDVYQPWFEENVLRGY